MSITKQMAEASTKEAPATTKQGADRRWSLATVAKHPDTLIRALNRFFDGDASEADADDAVAYLANAVREQVVRVLEALGATPSEAGRIGRAIPLTSITLKVESKGEATKVVANAYAAPARKDDTHGGMNAGATFHGKTAKAIARALESIPTVEAEKAAGKRDIVTLTADEDGNPVTLGE